MNFYFITDETLSVNGVLDDVKEALLAGANFVQYRDKNGSTKHMHETGMRIRELCTKYGAKYIVNDRLDIALSTGADGVHIGQDDMPLKAAREILPHAIIGVSCGTLEDAERAVNADYLGVTPIYPTSTKPDAGTPVGLNTLQHIAKGVNIPIVAIGGITLERVEEVMKAGATSVSAISATVGDDVQNKVSEFIEEIGRWRP